jgi:hypothetical protein
MLNIQYGHINLPAWRILVIFAVTACCLSCLPSTAAAPLNTDSDDNTGSAADPKTLENLKLLRSCLAMLNKDSLIVATATQRRTSMHALSPNFFGSTVIVPIPPPTGYLTGGPAAPNAGLLKAVVIDIHSRLSEATQMAQTVVIPKDIGSDTLQKWTQTLDLINAMVKHYNQVEQLSSKPQADTLRLGQETLAMYEDTSRAERLSKSVYASLKDAYSGEHNVFLANKKRNIY